MTTKTDEQEREAFEAWAKGGFHLERGLNGDYRAVITQIAWACWQAAVELDRQDQHADAFERDHQKAVRAIEVAGIPEIQGLSPENAFSTLAFMLDRQQAMPPKEWFDTFMELARDVAVANRAIARDTSTANQKLTAEAAQALQDHARRRLADDRQGRGEPVAWLVAGPYQKQAFAMKSSAEAFCRGLNKGFEEPAYSVSALYAAPQPAEPVKEASDGEIRAIFDGTAAIKGNYLVFARELLARYGQPAQPASADRIMLLQSVREYLQEGINYATQCEDAERDSDFALQLGVLLYGPLYTAPVAAQPSVQGKGHE